MFLERKITKTASYASKLCLITSEVNSLTMFYVPPVELSLSLVSALFSQHYCALQNHEANVTRVFSHVIEQYLKILNLFANLVI